MNSGVNKVMSTILLHDGNDATKTVPLDNSLPAGYYFLHVINPAKKTETFKIVIN